MKAFNNFGSVLRQNVEEKSGSLACTTVSKFAFNLKRLCKSYSIHVDQFIYLVIQTSFPIRFAVKVII